MKILIGTGNPAKFDRYKMVLERFEGLEILSLKDIDKDILPVLEDGNTAEENSRKKASSYSRITGLPTLSIDEALYIDALPDNEQPGVKVRRYDSDIALSDDEMIEKFLQKTKSIPDKEKTVTWIYAICLCRPDGKQLFTQVELKELLSDKPKLPMIQGYPLSSLLVDPNTNKFQSEYTKNDWENYLNPVYEKVYEIISQFKNE